MKDAMAGHNYTYPLYHNYGCIRKSYKSEKIFLINRSRLKL